MKIMKRLVTFALAVAILFSAVPMQAKEQKNNMETLYKSYVPINNKSFCVSEGTRIIILKSNLTETNETLFQYVQLVDEEIKDYLGLNQSFAICLGNKEQVKTGDIVIDMSYTRSTSHEEEYCVNVRDFITVFSASERGVLYGLRTVSDLIESKETEYADIVDYPDVDERSLHIDMARTYYTKDWLIREIKQLSNLKINTLQLHFSENEGFRLECDSHPEVMSEQYVTKDEMKEVLKTAIRYGVDIIPSLDAPGHLGQVLKNHSDYQLKMREMDSYNQYTGELGEFTGEMTTYESALDITNPEAVQFIKDLYDEYAELFKGCKYFHVGCDEFVNFTWLEKDVFPGLTEYAKKVVGPEAVAIDAYVYYANNIAEYMENKGFIVRMWNDGFYRSDTNQLLELKKSVEIDYWQRQREEQASVQSFIDKGYKLMNFCDKASPLSDENVMGSYMYYVNAGMFYQHPEGEKIFQDWHPGLFSNWGQYLGVSKQEYERGEYPTAVLGASFAIWNDTNFGDAISETPEQTQKNIQEPLLAMSQVCWDCKINTAFASYDEFKAAYRSLDEIAGLDQGYTVYQEVKELEKKSATDQVLQAPTIKTAKTVAEKKGVFVKITVNAVKGADHYEIYRVVGNKVTLVGATDSGELTLQDKKVKKKGVTYYAVAVASDGTKSAVGMQKKAEIGKSLKQVKAEKVFGKIRISWKKVEKAEKYVIYRSNKKNGKYTKIGIIKKKTVMIDRKAKKGKNYYKIAVVAKGKTSLLSKASKPVRK